MRYNATVFFYLLVSLTIFGSAVIGFQLSESGTMTNIGKFTDLELKGARDVALSPDGKLLVVACSLGNSVVTFDRDIANGLLKKKQVFVDGIEGPTLLAGCHATVFNRKGSRLYVVSGRFGGDNGFTIFNVSPNGHVAFDNPVYPCLIFTCKFAQRAPTAQPNVTVVTESASTDPILVKPPTRTSVDRFVRRRIVRVKLEVLERVI